MESLWFYEISVSRQSSLTQNALHCSKAFVYPTFFLSLSKSLVLIFHPSNEFANLHERNNGKRERDGDEVFFRTDGGEFKSGIDAGDIDDEQSQKQREHKCAPKVLILFFHGKHGVMDRPHIKGMEHLRHG